MAETIKVSTEEMQATLNTYNTQKAAQLTAYESMKTTVSGLSGGWIGEASQSFQNQFQTYYANIAQSEQKMADAVDELAKANELFTATEVQSLKSGATALEVGRSPFS